MQIIDNFEIKKYNQNLEYGCKKLSNFYPNRNNNENESDFFSLYSFLLEIAEKKNSIKKQIDYILALSINNNYNDISNNEM